MIAKNKSRLKLLILIMIILVISVACDKEGSSADSPDSPESENYPTDSTSAEVTIELFDVYLNPHNLLSAQVMFKTNRTVDAYVEYGISSDFGMAISPVTIEIGSSAEMLVLGLLPETTYYLRAVATDEYGNSVTSETVTVSTVAWPESWPVASAESFSDDITLNGEGVTCFEKECRDRSSLLMCVNRAGVPVWYYQHPDNAKMQMFRALSDGTLVGISPQGNEIFFFTVDGETTAQYDIDWFDGKTEYEHSTIHHDIIEITEGTWQGAVAFLTSSVEQVDYPVFDSPVDPSSNEFLNLPYDLTDPESQLIDADGIIVFDRASETVLWDWSAHGEPGDNASCDPVKLPYTRRGLETMPSMTGALDWLHANALLHGVDNGGQFFWISLRHQDWIVKLYVDAGDIEWRFGYLGDFELVDDVDAQSPVIANPLLWMYHQHAPEWITREDGSYNFLAYDNGNVRATESGELYTGEAYSRVVGFKLDEYSMLAEVGFSYGDSEASSNDYFFSEALGDADMMPGGESLMFVKGRGTPWIAEISYPGGELLWELSFQTSGDIYRVNYFPDLNTLTWR
jgi:Arylsulfotransferase (ASST)